MRHVVVSTMAVAALALFGAERANAYGTNHAFCMQGDQYPGLSYCTFDSYEQCQATASGRNLSCLANPYYNGPSDDPYAYQNRNRPFPPNYVPVPPNAYRATERGWVQRNLTGRA